MLRLLLRLLHLPQRSRMLFTSVLLPPRELGTMRSYWTSRVLPHRRHFHPSRASTAILTARAILRLRLSRRFSPPRLRSKKLLIPSPCSRRRFSDRLCSL